MNLYYTTENARLQAKNFDFMKSLEMVVILYSMFWAGRKCFLGGQGMDGTEIVFGSAWPFQGTFGETMAQLKNMADKTCL